MRLAPSLAFILLPEGCKASQLSGRARIPKQDVCISRDSEQEQQGVQNAQGRRRIKEFLQGTTQEETSEPWKYGKEQENWKVGEDLGEGAPKRGKRGVQGDHGIRGTNTECVTHE